MTKPKTQTQPEIYGTKQAAAYLGMDYSLFRYHLYEMGHIEPDLRVGKTLAFTKQTLDRFKELYQAEDGYTVKQAAQYLGVEVSWVRHHIFNTRLLVADAKRGKKAIFHQDTLDAIKERFLQKPQEPQPTN